MFIFIFMSALIGGLAEFIVSRTVGDISHVTIEAEERDPAVLITGEGHVLAVIEPGGSRTATLSEAEAFLPLMASVPGVVRRLAADHGRGVPDPRRAGRAGQCQRAGAGGANPRS